MENLHLGGTLVLGGGLFFVGEDIVLAVTHFDKTHMGRIEGGLEQGVEHLDIAGNHPVFGGRCQLVGDQLAGVIQLLAQVLQAHEGEKAGQQQGQQQGRAYADQLCAGMDVQAATQVHGICALLRPITWPNHVHAWRYGCCKSGPVYPFTPCRARGLLPGGRVFITARLSRPGAIAVKGSAQHWSQRGGSVIMRPARHRRWLTTDWL